jgi:nitroreductase
MDRLTAIQQRFSVRSYADRSIDARLLEQLLRFAENAVPPKRGEASSAPQKGRIPPRVALLSGADRVARVLTFMIGSYGFVNNAPHLLVGVLPEESEEARIDLGYVLEQVVLEATRLGLGTCWITGTYNAEQAKEALTLGPDEVAAAVCALGYPTEQGLGRLHTEVIRRLARGHRRKPLTEIVFDRRWGEPWSPQEPDPALVTMLEHARLAPSAHNGQPWRFVVDADQMTLALVRQSFIDAGIVMSHVSLASAALAREGRWEIRLRDEALARRCDLPHRAIPIATFDLTSG